MGETRAPGPRRWRRCLITTAAIEIAARTAIAIRIGTRGEDDEPELFDAVEEATGFSVPMAPFDGLALPPEFACPPWLPPASVPVLGLPDPGEDWFPDPLDPVPPPPPEPPLPAPGGALELSAGGLLMLLWCCGAFSSPSTPGISVSYCGPTLSA